MKPLIILEMANNHMGDLSHGKYIIEKFFEVTKKFNNFLFAFKFQFRNLDSFIHPDFKNRADLKYVGRFLETKLSKQDFVELKKFAESFGFLTICTAFD